MTSKPITVGTDHNGTPVITVDLDTLDLTRVVAGDLGRIDFIRNGKRVTVGLSIFQNCVKRDPTLLVEVCNNSRHVKRVAQIKPWTEV